MCVQIERNKMFVQIVRNKDYYYYNIFIIFVFMFMGGGHVTIMLPPNHHDYYNITCSIIQYVQSHNCLSMIFVVVSYMNHVSQ